jgi:hypothetical protein
VRRSRRGKMVGGGTEISTSSCIAVSLAGTPKRSHCA